VIKTFDKKGLHTGKFSVKYKDDPNRKDGNPLVD